MATPIAITGMGCLFPGARNPTEFWRNLVEGRDLISNAGLAEFGFDPGDLFHPSPDHPDSYYSVRGGFVRDYTFDPSGYELPPDQLRGADPQITWSLDTARQALVDGGINGDLSRCGVVLGNLALTTRSARRRFARSIVDSVEQELRPLFDRPLVLDRLADEEYDSAANDLLTGFPAALVARALGLGGPRFALDAACASSLYAIKLASDYLAAGAADLMLAGGTSCADPLFIHMGFSIFRGYPENGVSNPLDRNSSGLVSGEGAGMVLLKRYEDALRDGDRVHAVVRGAGLSNDGAGRHLLVPKARGQALSFRRAYSAAEVDPDSVSYVECHATGTHLGDSTELDSMEAFFAAEHMPQIGSVKSNLGHLLTASGIASVIKVVLSMAHDLLPPTINVREPMESCNGAVGADQLVRVPTPWSRQAGPRRAAISSFGFGGTNAHVVLEDPADSAVLASAEGQAGTPDGLARSPRLAITGMEIHAGRFSSLNEFDAAVYRGEQATGDDSTGSFEFDFLRSKVPPDPADRPISQQLLMTKIADRAVLDAGLKRGANVAIIVGMGTDPAALEYLTRMEILRQRPELLDGVEDPDGALTAALDEIIERLYPRPGINHCLSLIGNTTACRIASVWDFTGPAFMLSTEENSAVRALEVARLLLGSCDLDAVVVAAVDIGRDQLSTDDVPDNAAAGAIVVRRHQDAVRDGNRIYASIDAIEFVASPVSHSGELITAPSADASARAQARALAAAGISASAVGYVERCGNPADGAEFAGLALVYGSASLDTAAGSGVANAGNTGAAAGIVGIIRATLCLTGRYLPPAPGWTGPDSAFHLGQFAAPWFSAQGLPRVAAVSSPSVDGSAGALILSEGNAAGTGDLLTRRTSAELLPVSGSSVEELLAALGLLEARLSEDGEFSELACRIRVEFSSQIGQLTVVLLAGDDTTLRAQIQAARAGIHQAAERQEDWESPAGSYFTPQPLGPDGGVTFVYPGAFNSYLGMGRGLLPMFPALHDRLAARVPDPGPTAGDRLLYPRSSRPLSEPEAEAAARRLRSDAVTMMESGTTLAVLHTLILREEFGVRPSTAFGYSMGEGTMLWSLEAWQDGADDCPRLRSSPLFTEQLVGPCLAAQEWARRSGSVVGEWASYLVGGPAKIVRTRLDHEPRAFLSHINTPTQVVISGDKDTVESVIADLGLEAIRAPTTMALHCEPTRVVFDDLVALNRHQTHDVTGVRCYSIADYGLILLSGNSAAETIAEATCQPVDFPRLVDRVYNDGARIFVELGPSNSCSKWIQEILRDRPHVVAPMNRRDLDDSDALLRVLARLTSHRVPLDLGRLDSGVANPEVSRPRSREMVGRIPLRRPPLAGVLADFRATYAGLAVHRRADAHSAEPVLATEHLPAVPPLPTKYLSAEEAIDVVWNEEDLVEFGTGKIANAFGSEYSEIDTFSRRVRLPAEPYLLVSRVTALRAQRGVFEPCSITTEYDIPFGAWYTVDGQIPWAVAVESGQCDLLLISYLGIDFTNRGERVYRLLDCTLTFLGDLPKEGQTLRYEIRIDSFARTGDTLLFFFHYDCYVGDELVLKMTGGCAGFFTDAELARGRGVVDSPGELVRRRDAVPAVFTPPLRCDRRAFSAEDLHRLSTGRLAACFGPDYEQAGRNPSLRLPPAEILVLSRITDVDPAGGAWGLGTLTAEHDLDPENWYFPCHFVDDQVLAGSLMAEACFQLLQFYLLFLGFPAGTTDARFQPIPGVGQAVRCRGQVTPQRGTLTYRMEVTELGAGPIPSARADVDVILDGLTVVRFTDVALQLAEKVPPTTAVAETAALESEPAEVKPAEVKPAEVKPVEVAPVEVRPVRYDERQVVEFTAGSISACFGPEFSIYDDRRAPRLPNGDLQLVSRGVSLEGELGDLRAGSAIVTEYDMPTDPWFCAGNSFPVTPYSILMEIGLQPCGFLSAALGSPMTDPDKDFYFRNLDGSGQLLHELDLRGRRITGRARLSQSNSLAGVIIQRFDYSLECEGTVFFSGDTSFGYFTAESLSTGAGLDDGRTVPSWLRQSGRTPQWTDLDEKFLRAPAGRPHQRLAGGQLHFLDRVAVVSGGGTHGLGYVLAEKGVDPASWFFRCHFHQDPVMPGSLGVEAIIEAMQLYVLRSGLCDRFTSPRFGSLADHRTVWRYRGQIAPTNRLMTLEAHIANVETRGDQLVVTADASLWCEDLRIYAVKQLAITVTEA